MRCLRFRFSTVSTNMEAAYCTFSSPEMADSMFNSCRARNRASSRNLERTYSEYRSQPINRRCCGRSTHALDIANVPARQYTTRPTEKMNLRAMFLINIMTNCSEKSSTFELDTAKPVWKTSASCGRRGKFDIRLSIQDVSIICRQARLSTRVQAWTWTVIPYTKISSFVPPRLYAAGTSIMGLAVCYHAHDRR